MDRNILRFGNSRTERKQQKFSVGKSREEFQSPCSVVFPSLGEHKALEVVLPSPFIFCQKTKTPMGLRESECVHLNKDLPRDLMLFLPMKSVLVSITLGCSYSGSCASSTTPTLQLLFLLLPFPLLLAVFSRLISEVKLPVIILPLPPWDKSSPVTSHPSPLRNKHLHGLGLQACLHLMKLLEVPVCVGPDLLFLSSSCSLPLPCSLVGS